MNNETDKDLDFTSLKPLEVLYEEAVEELSEKEAAKVEEKEIYFKLPRCLLRLS